MLNIYVEKIRSKAKKKQIVHFFLQKREKKRFLKVRLACLRIMFDTTIKFGISNFRNKKKSVRKFAPLFLTIFLNFYIFSIFAHRALFLIHLYRHKLLCILKMLFTSLL